MNDGIYSVSFATPTMTAGKGVCYVEGGRIRGGDSAYAYFGPSQQVESKLTASLDVVQHDPSSPSIFGPIANFELQLSGVTEGDRFALSGGVPGNSTMTITVRGRKIRDLPIST